MATIGVTQPAAIVLTGGLSSRMGTDKASLVVDGLAMRDRVVQQLNDANIATIAVAGSPEIPDPAPEQGPMAGVVAGWRHLQLAAHSYDPILVLSCDLPSLSSEVIAALAVAAVEHQHGAVAYDGERLQPLIAAYRPIALKAIEAAYEAGQRSVRRCFTNWDLGQVQFDPPYLQDADTPDDLKGFDVQWPNLRGGPTSL